MNFSILKEITLFIHSLPEQAKIANFLAAIDGQLEEVEAQIAHTKLFKQGSRFLIKVISRDIPY